MSTLIIPATLAALCLFRWARTLALFVFGAAVVWFALTVSGHAQRTPVVECTVGLHLFNTTDQGCDLLQDVYARMKLQQNPQHYLETCSHELSVMYYHPTNVQICVNMSWDVIRGWPKIR